MPQLRPKTGLRWSVGLAVLLVAIAAGVRSQPLSAANQQTATVFPGADWERVADPRAIGYCQDRLDLATARVKALPTTGMAVIVGGRLLWEYGDLTRVSYLASVRKSILAMMYGPYVESGRIRLDKTMADLKIDDVAGLLPAEKEATVGDLLAARSGVYHEAANAACTGCGSTAGDPPGPRGSVKHGTYFLYNNWDFNVLGTIFEQETGSNIYDAFERDLAKPAGLQDFDRAAQRKSENRRASIHPAYHFYLSTRDMARIGYIMLRNGAWAGTQLVPRDWVRRIVTHRDARRANESGVVPEGTVRVRVPLVDVGRPVQSRRVQERLQRHRRGGAVHHRAAGARYGRRPQDRAPGWRRVGLEVRLPVGRGRDHRRALRLMTPRPCIELGVRSEYWPVRLTTRDPDHDTRRGRRALRGAGCDLESR